MLVAPVLHHLGWRWYTRLGGRLRARASLRLGHITRVRYAARLGLDVAAFDRDRTSSAVADRIRRDVDSGLASDQVLGTPTLFIDGLVHRQANKLAATVA